LILCFDASASPHLINTLLALDVFSLKAHFVRWIGENSLKYSLLSAEIDWKLKFYFSERNFPELRKHIAVKIDCVT
tara:strand:- start:71 stop:298 length:228 start_codon:yes stop_codon:yes gene_type:complete